MILPFILALALLYLILPAHAQEAPPTLAWEARYNVPYSYNVATAAVTDEAGHIYVTGSSQGESETSDFLTVKYAPDGSELWRARYNDFLISWDCTPVWSNLDDVPALIEVDAFGNVYVTGTSLRQYDCNSMDYGQDWYLKTVKYDAEGNEQWVASSFAGDYWIGQWNSFGSRRQPLAMAVDESGNVYVTGWKKVAESIPQKVVTSKYSPDGDRLWHASYEPGVDEGAVAVGVSVDHMDTASVVGLIWESNRVQGSFKVDYDADGQAQRTTRYSFPGEGYALTSFVKLDPQGDLYVSIRAQEDLVTIRYDASGNMLWMARYAGLGDDIPAGLELDTGGNVYVTGSSQGAGDAYDFVTIKYDDQGDEVWSVLYDSTDGGSDKASSLCLLAEGDLVVVGASEGADSGYDIATVLYDANGVERWVARYVGTRSEDVWPAPVVGDVDPSGNVIVAGSRTGARTGSEYAMVKYSPAGEEQWVNLCRTMEVDGLEEHPMTMAVDGEGRVYVSGSSCRDFIGHCNIVTAKYDADGAPLWVSHYDGPAGGSDEGVFVIVSDSGYVYVVGITEGIDTETDFVVIKYDASGDEVWVRHHDGPLSGRDGARSATLDAHENIYVTGTSSGDCVTVKYDELGNELWVSRYEGADGSEDGPVAILLDQDGDILVAGSSMMDYGYSSDYFAVKYSADGEELWVGRYDGPENGHDFAHAMAVDDFGHLYVTGSSGQNHFEPPVYATIKYDRDGNIVWIARYAGTDPESDTMSRATAVDVDELGYVYVTGMSEGDCGQTEYATVKYDSEGNELWVRRYGLGCDARSSAYPSALALDPWGNVYVTGGTRRYVYSHYQTFTVWLDQHFVTIKYDSDGIELWRELYDGPCGFGDFCVFQDGDDNARAMTVDEAGNVYVIGASEGMGTGHDFATLKYVQDLSCNDEDEDGYGNPSYPSCARADKDCDNGNPDVYPSAPEICDGLDNQCPGNPGYGQTDEGCGLVLVAPENGASLVDPPTFAWQAGPSDQFYVYLVMPVFGYGYLTFVVPTQEQSLTLPSETWDERVVIPNWWSAWIVLGIDTTVDPPTLEASELRWFRKVM